MADKPIIFSAPMVRALLDGRKTQTRRVLKPQPDAPDATFNGVFGLTNYASFAPFCGGASQLIRLPYAPGDRLWVRETWSGEHVFRMMPPASRPVGFDLGEGNAAFRDNIWYWADGGPEFGDWERPRPPIHMPRWASRMTLGVTEVRVQRLQEISEADARAEGGPPSHPSIDRVSRDFGYADFPRSWFAQTWNTIHGPDAWDANPWVCALTFTVHRCNIDQMPGAGE